MKQFLTILAILIVLSGVGIAAYFLFFAHDAPHLQVSNTNSSFSDAVSKATVTMATTTDTSTTNAVGGAGTLIAPGLVEITKDPVAAGTAVFAVTTGIPNTTSTSTGTTTSFTNTKTDVAVHYIDRASGNVYEYLVFGRSLTRIGNKTLPGVQKASWLHDGSMAFSQFISNTSGIEHVVTYALPALGTGGYFLQQDLSQAFVVGSSTVFTLAEGTNSSVGTIAQVNGSNARTLFTTTLTNLNVFPAGNSYIATPKAAASLDGYAFAINSGGVFTPIMGPLKGLSVLPSPSGNLVLYSYNDGNVLTMGVFDRTTGGVTKLPLATPTEKCTWASNNASLYCAIPTKLSGTLPDDWYQGVTSFSDRIWNIDLLNHTATMTLNPETAKVTLDAVNLTADPNSHVLIFRNKNDSSLWAYDL